MIFSSLIFLYLFLPLCLLCYASVKKIQHRNIVLVIFSLLFYAWGEPTRIIYLLLSTLINYLCGLGVDKYRNTAASKVVLGFSLLYNLGMIGVFKYSGFLMENVNALFGSQFPVPEIAQLVGISFYTFQVMSYVIDCYWEKVEPQRNLLKFLLYVSLFPQLIAGPIVRYSTIAEEIDDRRTTLEDLSGGLTRFVIGLSKKVILADQLFRIVDDFLGGIESQTMFATWYGVIIYSLYIYFDFSGYSDMAIGLGRIFGFHFDENFNHPFLCKDITEFWQRWHISLGSFFRDYLLPLSFFGIRNKYLSLGIVWLCTGIWHGASWNYIIWGLYYGAFILLETRIGKKKMRKIPIVLRHIYNKIVIIIGFGIFYFEDTAKLLTFLKNLTPLNPNGITSSVVTISLYNNLFLILAAILFTFPILALFKKLSDRSLGNKVCLSVAGTITCAALLLLSSVLLVDATTKAFLYYRF